LWLRALEVQSRQVILLAIAMACLSGCAMFVGGGKVRVEPPMTNGCLGICQDKGEPRLAANDPTDQEPKKGACSATRDASLPLSDVARDAVGTYLFAPGAPIEVHIEDGKLVAEGASYPRREWCVIAPVVFRTATGNPRLTYVLERDPAGRVTGIGLLDGEAFLHMPRVPSP